MTKIWTGCCLAAWLLAAPAAHAASQAAAVIDDGYAGKVLNRILDTGKLKFSQTMELRLSLDDSGHLLECRGTRGADATAACAAAKAASPFGTPPYGVPTYVTLAFWSGSPPAAKADAQAKQEAKAVKTASKDASLNPYLTKIRTELRNAMYIPEQTKPGSYHVTARIKCDSAGKILDSAILKGSGDARLDKYVLQGIRRAGKITPPPAGAGDTFELTFTLVRR
ncbi:MAG: TonB C-terminal domain-containing protein [Desulfovibrio sp.]|nr:TonB C-terminal domain-containing protein [Desulfovibrio sp.]